MGYTYINVTSCFAVSVSLLALSILAVSLRVFIRWRTQIKPGHTFWQTHLDDVLCVLALIPCIGTTVALIYGTRKRIIGSHNLASNAESWMTTTTPDLVILEKLVYIIFIMQPLALGFMKLSVLFFYRRIFSIGSFTTISTIFIIITIGWMLAFFFGFVFTCRLNFSANWGSLAGISEHCPFGFLPTIIFTVLDAVLDLCILILPLPCIWALKLPSARKAQVFGVFLLGGFALSAATVRMVICIKQNTPSNAVREELIMGMPIYDIVGITSHGLFWTVVEVNVALIACCLPTLRPILSTVAVVTVTAFFGSMFKAIGYMSRSAKVSEDSVTDDESYNGIEFAKVPSGKEYSFQTRAAMPKNGTMSPFASDLSLVRLEQKFGTLGSLQSYQ
ncbi:hypothetical protein HBI56_127970 [Parastagonospora nodorum]|uniref:Rhodopsin domain-containing protein n=1 Tax=Phaeosphaeria nodorum (strain SN15 / ATCC MYA-4574 / FGSC 10173) TaxID=321614 RepID=A0A7U2F3G3_PHANO|nr:hypothetical protein HBH56_155860 [Parastagonospora nodorum]QRC95824.1 hypothetical protein JI435_054760 [Parastagonospora nodorum SN15]KAH3926835.1 hypothetical protein HBH54_161810 [Parastagonospora nodorum]KAH3943342.1 hypothetical protein HBH53_177350 [Parastagonospora nodorum]KAH3972188.1 hypothetical protein HBH51_104150 [Parastagonospora nodorum]